MPQTISPPAWLGDLLETDLPAERSTVQLGDRSYVMRGGILRADNVVSDEQAQTGDTFGFKWHQRETFESDTRTAAMRSWLVERYGDVAAADWWADYGERPILLDAGCGAGVSGFELFQPILPDIRYLGVDISTAVEVAAERFAGLPAAFVQADITDLPFPAGSVDVAFSEGVLHHTDSTRRALLSVAELLRSGGRFLFYVYRRKGPIREFTDDYVRERIQDMAPEVAWEALRPLTRLGEELGKLNATIDVPEDIDLLGIPAGRTSVQRLFYWHVIKAFYGEDLSTDEMHHINFDWFAPANAHRQSPEEVRAWCQEAGLEIEHENIQGAGITVVARKR